MTTLTVNVTAEDIETGDRHECDKCPVALALLRAAKTEFGDDRIVWVNADDDELSFHVRYTATVLHEPTPEDVRDFIAAFDAGDPVEPFSFTADFE